MEKFSSSTLPSILRGLYATPIICELSKNKIFTKETTLINKKNYEKIKNKFILNLCLDYLSQLNITFFKKGNWHLTDFGFEIFKRSNSFFVPHSYREVILNLGNILSGKKKIESLKIDRNENIIGSGLTHLRYFYSSLNYCNNYIKFDTLVDLGCGNGDFINLALKFNKDLKIIGIDLSNDSVNLSKKNINNIKKKDFTIFKSDIADVTIWNRKIKKLLINSKTLISMWFMLHEISNHKVKNLKIFLNKLYYHFPNSNLLIGEIVKHDNKVLNEIYQKSLMPEYLFFHKASGQGILSWNDYKLLLIDCPYTLEYESKFDDNNSKKIPAAFVWILKPKKNYGYKNRFKCSN
jgi:SAM-dependent methyltransferase